LAVTVGTVVTGRACARRDVVGGTTGAVVIVEEGADERGAVLRTGGVEITVSAVGGTVVTGAVGSSLGVDIVGGGVGRGLLVVDDATNSPGPDARPASCTSAPALAPVMR
jgi:hypothetical protein